MSIIMSMRTVPGYVILYATVNIKFIPKINVFVSTVFITCTYHYKAKQFGVLKIDSS